MDRLLPILAAALAPDQELHSVADAREYPVAQKRPPRSAQVQCHGRVQVGRREVWRVGPVQSLRPPCVRLNGKAPAGLQHSPSIAHDDLRRSNVSIFGAASPILRKGLHGPSHCLALPVAVAHCPSTAVTVP